MTKEETISKVISQAGSEDTTPLHKVIELIKSISSATGKKDISGLLEFIEKDAEVSGRVLRTAFPSSGTEEKDGVEVHTIEQAVRIIGLDKIVSVLMTIVAAQELNRNISYPSKLELLSLSILTGLVARNFSTNSGIRDADICFASGLFRHYGDILLSRSLPEQYSLACHLAQDAQISREDCFRKIFGIGSMELARYVLEHMKMPGTLWKSIREVDDPDMVDPVTLAGSFAGEVGEIMNSQGLERSRYDSEISDLITRYQEASGINIRAFNQIFTELNTELQDLQSSGGIPELAPHLSKRLQIITSGSDEEFPEAPALEVNVSEYNRQANSDLNSLLPGLPEVPYSELTDKGIPSPRSRLARSKAFFHEGIHKIVNFTCDLMHSHEEITSQICKVAMAGFRARNVFFFAPSGHEDCFISFLNYGPEASKSGSVPNFSGSDGSFLARAVSSKEPVLISSEELNKEPQAIRAWIGASEELSPYIAWPLKNRDTVSALILMSGGDQYAMDEFEIASRQMVQFFRFASLCLSTRKVSKQNN
jgi:HD-like signal output (HDOD) protein